MLIVVVVSSANVLISFVASGSHYLRRYPRALAGRHTLFICTVVVVFGGACPNYLLAVEAELPLCRGECGKISVALHKMLQETAVGSRSGAIAREGERLLATVNAGDERKINSEILQVKLVGEVMCLCVLFFCECVCVCVSVRACVCVRLSGAAKQCREKARERESERKK